MYGHALTELRRALRNDSATLTELALACIVMATVESLREKAEEMLIHLRIGLRICQDRSTNAVEDSVLWALSRQGYLHALHGRPRVCSAPEVYTLDPPLITHTKERLETTEDASNVLSDLSRAILQYILKVDQHAFTSELDRCCEQTKLLAKLDRWRREMEYLGHDTTIPDSSRIPSVSHLLARFWSQRIFLTGYAEGRQCAYDDYTDCFERTVAFIELALRGTAPASFALASGSIAVLFNVILACRELGTRERALDLLRVCPRREGAWDAWTMLKAGRYVIDFEESHRTHGQIPEKWRVQQLKLEKVDGEDVVVLVTRPQGVDERTVVHFQDL